MRPALQRVGASESPVVMVDDVTGDVAGAVAIATALAPFPPADGSTYPGLRRVVTGGDGAAIRYMTTLLERAAPLIGAAFGAASFDLLEASFSMVTRAPGALAPPQRAPHFDSTDPDCLAVMHYLSPTAGTAFYRQRATGIETVDEGNMRRFVAEARRGGAAFHGYIGDGNAAYERIGAVEGVPDRLVIYRGSLLHSGLIAPGQPLSPDPRVGRLTANLFLAMRRNGAA